MMRPRRFIAVGLALSAIAAGCGSSSSTTGATTTGAATSGAVTTGAPTTGAATTAAGDERTQRAIDAGTKAAGTPIALPTDIKIGFVNVYTPSEALQRGEKENKAAAELLGWSYETCDGQANPTQMATCMETFINEGVSAIILGVISPAAIMPQLQAAKDKGIPVINIIGAVDNSPLLAAQLADPKRDGEIAAVIDKYMFDTLEKEYGTGGPIKISVNGIALPLGVAREDQLNKDLKDHPAVEIAAHSSISLTDPAQWYRETTTAVLQAHPDIKAFWDCGSTGWVSVPSVVAEKLGDKAFPERPLIVGFIDDLQNIQQVRLGRADAIGTFSIDVDSWVAFDQLAQFFARKKAVDPNASDTLTAYGLDLIGGAALITKDNLPPEGENAPTKEDFRGFFKAKWKAEFAISAS